MNSSAQPTASAHSSSRMKPEDDGVAREPEDEAVPDQAEQHHDDQGADDAQPDPQRDPADVAAAGGQLGGAGKHEGHQQQRHGAAEADAGTARRLRGAARRGPRGAGAPNPGEETGGMSGPFERRWLRRSSITSHIRHTRHGAPGRPVARRSAAPAVPSAAWQTVPRAPATGARQSAGLRLARRHATQRGRTGSYGAGGDDATQVQPGRPRSGPRDPEPTQMLPTVDRARHRAGRAAGPCEPPAAGPPHGGSRPGRRPVAHLRRRAPRAGAPRSGGLAQGRAGRGLAGVPGRRAPDRVVARSTRSTRRPRGEPSRRRSRARRTCWSAATAARG